MDIILAEDLSIGSAVITETGVLLGWLRKLGVADDTSNRLSLILSGIPFLWIPEVVSSAYELSIEEVISSGHNRLIVFEGAEQRVKVLTIGVLGRLGIFKAPHPQTAYSLTDYSWNDENDEDDDGFSPATIPRQPSPKPTDGEAEIPVE
jgi:hypothetical protein